MSYSQPILRIYLSFCYFVSISERSISCISEHTDPLAKKEHKEGAISEYTDPHSIVVNLFVYRRFRSMLTPCSDDLLYIYFQVIIKIGSIMAGNKINMSIIKEIIRQYFEDKTSKKCIAKNLAISKNTVKKYLTLAQADPLDYKSLLKIDDPILQYRFSSGNPAYSSDKYDDFKSLIKYYANELSDKHVTKKLLWEEYSHQNADGYKYTQFCHHLNQSIKRKPSVVTILSDTYVPGEKLFVDYAGDLLEYTDQFTNKVVKCQFFIACLPYSDYTFALAVHSQCQEDFMHALIQCFHAIGGVPKILVTDNLKAAVIKPSYKHSPTLNNLLVQVATHYRTTVIPTKPYSPTHKAKVESQVRIMYQRVYAKLRKRRFFSLHELNRAISEAVKQHNQTRMTDRTYSREEHFLSREKNYLKELPESDFEIKYIAELKVRDDCCIKLTRDKHYYSVPYQYIGQYALVEYTRTMVKIFLKGKGLLIATHSREMGMGERTIKKEHLATNSLSFLNKTKENYIERGFKRTPLLGEIINHMLNLPDTPAEFFYRRCDELLHMEASNKAAYNFALRIAYDHNILSPKRIKNLYNNAVAAQGVLEGYEDDNLVPKSIDNLRGESYYKY